jgi:plastocyanin
MRIYYFVIITIIIFSMGIDYAFAGTLMGDGMIATDELFFITPQSGFEDGETITISQQSATSATGTFTNLGEIAPSELTITSNVNGFVSQNVTLTQGLTTAQGFWTDTNGDTNVDNGEITVTEEGVLFENGQIDITASNGGNPMATADFVDSEDDVINDGELMISNGGAGFTTGTVTLIGVTSSAVTTASFFDSPVAPPITPCSVPVSGDMVVDSNCTLMSSATAPANVSIQNTSVMTIPNLVTFGIDFVNFNLTVFLGSGALIQSGGTIMQQEFVPVNQAPMVDAGFDLGIFLVTDAVLNGTVTDDGLPSASVSSTWTKQSGPGVVNFDNSSNVDTTASFSEIGDYVLRLTANDGEKSSFDEINVSVSINEVFVSIPAGTSVEGCENTDECYLPPHVTISTGGKVSWNVEEPINHTVASGNPQDGPDGHFDSSIFQQGPTFSHTFDTPGIFPYFCVLHPWATGTITVLDP